MRLPAKSIAIWTLGVLLGIQVIRPSHANPPTDTSKTFTAIHAPNDPGAAILTRACRDCHSNDTRWPWYSQVAPMSWLVWRDVHEGREHLNFSEWGTYDQERRAHEAKAICNATVDGEMPLWFYLPMHPDARLTSEDTEQLCGIDQ